LRGAGNYVGGLIDGAFNDTPGTVTAAPGYNVFGFAPGDIISARMGGISGGASLTDIFQVLRDSNLLDIQAYQTAREQRKLLQDVTNDVLKTSLLIHGNSEINTQRQIPSIIQMMQAFFPRLLTAVDSVRESLISTLTSIMGDRGGGGGGFGGVDASAAADIVNAAKGWEGEEFKRGVEAQCAFFVREVFKQAGRDVGVRRGSSPGLAGSFFDESVGELRHTLNPDEIPAGAIVGFENTYPGPGSGIGGFTHVGIAVGDGQMIDRSTRSAPVRQRPITTFPVDSRGGYTYIIPHSIQSTQPAAGGGSVNLSTGYESLEQLSGQLTSLDPRFNTNTPDGRAALAIALAIGGTEHFGLNQRETNFFTKMGGTGNNMMGFAQFNLGAHNRANIDTPQEYADYLADMLTGSRPRPDGRAQVDYASRLRSAVQSGQINSGRELEQWLRSAGLGRNNWQALDDGWSRTPGLSDQLLRMLRGGGDNRQASNNRTTNITVNIASATDPARTRQEVTNAIHAAMPYLDEFEQTRQNSSDRNPRNSGNLSPVYG
jgi:cell wall-associated NlpC family hydrolase